MLSSMYFHETSQVDFLGDVFVTNSSLENYNFNISLFETEVIENILLYN